MVPAMTAIIYFGEMIVALILAIFLLVTSKFSMGEGVVLSPADSSPSPLGEYHVRRFTPLTFPAF
jgi:hypothetical protein